MMKTNKVEYIPTLDGLRAIAIIAVLIAHLAESMYGEHILTGLGNYGVSLFFGISGYIISTYLLHELDHSNTIDFKKFYLKRVFRLMPVLWIYLLVVFGLGELEYIVKDYTGIFSSLTFWRNYANGEVVTGQLWSLSVEEHFYFILPALLLFLKKPKRIVIALLIICVGVALWRKLGTVSSFIDIFPFAKYHINHTGSRLDYMIYGVIAAYLQNHFKYIQERITIYPIFSISVIVITYLFKLPFEPIIRAIFFSMIILSTVQYFTGPVGKLLELRFIRYIGKISYSLYLWQQLLMYKMEKAPSYIKILTGEYWSIPIAIFIASLSYFLIETPIRKFGYSFLRNSNNSF